MKLGAVVRIKMAFQMRHCCDQGDFQFGHELGRGAKLIGYSLVSLPVNFGLILIKTLSQGFSDYLRSLNVNSESFITIYSVNVYILDDYI